MDIVKVTFNDNTVHEYRKGTLFYDASKDFDMENIVGYKINNEVFSLDNKILEDVKINEETRQISLAYFEQIP